MKNHIIVIYLLLFCTFLSNAQKDVDSYANCEGTVNIFKSHSYELRFLGVKGVSKSFQQYPALSKINSANQIWFSYVAPADGQLVLDVESVGKSAIKMVAFESITGNVCKDVQDGNAEVIRMITPKNKHNIGLSEQVNEAYLYPLNLEGGKVIQFVVIADSVMTDLLKINVQFNAIGGGNGEHEVREVSFRNNRTLPSIKVEVRDKDHKYPLVANLIIGGMNKFDGLYHVSDLELDILKRTKIRIDADLDGYFPIEGLTYYISGEKSMTVVVEMEQVQSGRSLQISNIDFVPGTSEVTEQSIPKLKRLKDFLALNASYKVEIQGHVFEPGEDNSFMGQKMSEARAKRIVKYLIDNGIAKDRLTAVGYGNQRPIYRFPKNASEEQANRRVEVLMK